jgi:hypothetical protein
MTENAKICQKCGSTVVPGMKFCESCGAKIEALAEESAADPRASVQTVEAVKEPQTNAPATTAPAPVPVKAGTEKIGGGTPKPPLPKQTWIIAGVVVLALLAAAVYFVVLPMISGTAAGSQGSIPLPVVPGATGSSPAPSSAPGSTPSTTPGGSVSFVTDPTQVPPTALLVTYQAERDPITGVVTVTFTGGAGKYGVRDTFIRLTRSDGQILTRTKTFTQIMQAETFQGTTTGDDRIEVTANYFNGDHYKIIDQILFFKKRF